MHSMVCRMSLVYVTLCGCVLAYASLPGFALCILQAVPVQLFQLLHRVAYLCVLHTLPVRDLCDLAPQLRLDSVR